MRYLAKTAGIPRKNNTANGVPPHELQCPKPMLYAISASDISLFNNQLSDSCGDITLSGTENVIDYDK